jgi:hypothetical protein
MSWRMVTLSYGLPRSPATYFVTGSSRLVMNPSFIATPTSVLVTDFATDCEVQRPLALWPSAYRSSLTAPSWRTMSPATFSFAMNRSSSSPPGVPGSSAASGLPAGSGLTRMPRGTGRVGNTASQ